MISNVSSGFSVNTSSVCTARGLSWDFSKTGDDARVPEKTEEEKKQEKTTSLPVRKELSKEEKEKLKQLKDTLTQLLASADSPPTREQKAYIRKVEKEIEKLTGIKMSQSNAQALDKLPEQDEDEEKKKKKKALFAQSEYLKQVQLSAISLPEDCGATEGGVMGQVLGAFANSNIDLSAAPLSSQRLKDITV